MTQRALLIGAQTGGLQGVDNDVAAMAGALESRGFRIATLTGADASRDGILDAYRRLIVDAESDDACVVYYSGHGGLLRHCADDRRVDDQRPDLQFIVPTDYTDSTADDFRGITAVELSVLLAQLTAVTPNATVVLDCCHSAHMSRQADGLRVKALLRGVWQPRPATYEQVRGHTDRLIAEGLPTSALHPYSNPYAVRLVACAPHESAWECTNSDGVHMGLFTDALSQVLLRTQHMRVSWQTIVDAVRRTVQDFVPAQRPETEGPSARQPFTTAELFAVGTLPVVRTAPDRIRLLGAPLLGVRPGDEFAVMPADAEEPQDDQMLATAIVDELEPMAAVAELRPAPGMESLPEDARAHQTVTGAPALAVHLPHGHPAAAGLAKAIVRRPLLRVAEPDEETGVAVVVDAQDRLVVRDELGPLHAPYPATPAGVERVVVNLQRLAQATALRQVVVESTESFDHRVDVRWGRVRPNGTTEPFDTTGALVYAHPDERIYFQLRNDGPDDVYVSLVDIGVGARIGLLTGADPSGIWIAAGATYTYGWDDRVNRLTGVAVTWPDTIDTTYARPETVLAIVSDAPVDVSMLQQEGLRGVGQARVTSGGPLERLLTQVATGATREVGRAVQRRTRHAVLPLDFMVSPTAPPSVEEATFGIDDRPAEAVRLLSPRGKLPGRVAVRINDVVVHRNRAWGDADVRLDTVVLTGLPTDRPAYTAKTMRLANVGDEDRLPLDNVLIYHGPAIDFLDIALWVCRDTKGSLELGDLLAHRLNDPLVQAAGTQLAGLTLTAPHAAAAVAAAGACAVVLNTAYRVLQAAVGPTIGLYRTSLLAQEQFGIGTHHRRSQDFSFTLSIEPVD